MRILPLKVHLGSGIWGGGAELLRNLKEAPPKFRKEYFYDQNNLSYYKEVLQK